VTMRLSRRLTVTVAVSIALTLTSTAFAFSRNITGVWQFRGDGIGVIHNSTSDHVSLVFPGFPNTGITRLEFEGQLEHTDGSMGPNDFEMDTNLEPISFTRKGVVCDITGTFRGRGVVLGQAPGRRMQMKCKMHLVNSCAGKEPTELDTDFNGEWR
jgi:hypothetical protein